MKLLLRIVFMVSPPSSILAYGICSCAVAPGPSAFPPEDTPPRFPSTAPLRGAKLKLQRTNVHPKFTHGPLQVPDLLRKWQSLIHPILLVPLTDNAV